ncbi:tail fiber protein [Chitinibacter sp. FCG-7]|uniref:Tail fiber protein n=1 Tax=Chitinibacter mangrovi TaxID=3153927 RepID=A0AAU7F623_9NEIS
MAEPFLAEIRVFSFVFAPKGWALCNGQLLPINQNQALFSLLGTTFGGDGRVNFALPDFRGRTPIHVGSGHSLGERGGEQAHTLSIAELPVHTHLVRAADAPANLLNPHGGIPGQAPSPQYSDTSPGNALETSVAAHASSISNVGGSQAHLNMQPFLTLNFCIALQGIFPSPT